MKKAINYEESSKTNLKKKPPPSSAFSFSFSLQKQKNSLGETKREEAWNRKRGDGKEKKGKNQEKKRNVTTKNHGYQGFLKHK